MALTHAEAARHRRELARARQGASLSRQHSPVAHIRHELRAAGYDVDKAGGATTRLMSAWKHYQSATRAGGMSQYEAVAWNKRNKRVANNGITRRTAARVQSIARGNGKGVPYRDKGLDKAVKSAGKTTKTHARARAHSQSLGAGGGGGSGSNIPGVGGSGSGADVNSLLPRSMADQLAGMQFDPQIHELLTQIEQGKRDESQHQTDIGHWYGQVMDAQGTARHRDTEASTAAKGSLDNSIAAVLQSLGGSRGAGVVGAAGVNDAAALDSQGSSQDRYNADLAPLLEQERAGAHSRQAALASQTRAGQDSNLVSLRGQRGQAQAQALMSLIQANNQSRQSNFGNRLALQNAGLAAESLGLDAEKTQAMLAGYGLDNKMKRAQLRAAQTAADPHANWGALSPDQKGSVMKDVLDRAVGELPAGAPWDPGHVLNSALGYLRGYGYHSARKQGFKGRIPNRRNQVEMLGYLHRELVRRGQGYGQQQSQ